jgi:hypothetical protein
VSDSKTPSSCVTVLHRILPSRELQAISNLAIPWSRSSHSQRNSFPLPPILLWAVIGQFDDKKRSDREFPLLQRMHNHGRSVHLLLQNFLSSVESTVNMYCIGSKNSMKKGVRNFWAFPGPENVVLEDLMLWSPWWRFAPHQEPLKALTIECHW